MVMLESFDKIAQTESPERKVNEILPALPKIHTNSLVKVMDRVTPLVSPLRRPNRYQQEASLPKLLTNSIQVSKVFHKQDLKSARESTTTIKRQASLFKS